MVSYNAVNSRRELRELYKELNVLEDRYVSTRREITYTKGQVSRLIAIEHGRAAPLITGVMLALNNTTDEYKDMIEFFDISKRGEVYFSYLKNPLDAASLFLERYPDDIEFEELVLDRTYLWLSTIEDIFGIGLDLEKRMSELERFYEELEEEAPKVGKYVYEGANTIFAEYVARQIPWLEKNLKGLHKEGDVLQYEIRLLGGKIELVKEREKAIKLWENEIERLKSAEAREINNHTELYNHNGHLRYADKAIKEMKKYVESNKNVKWLMRLLGISSRDGYGRMKEKHGKVMMKIANSVGLERFEEKNHEYGPSLKTLEELGRLNSLRETYESENRELIGKIKSDITQVKTQRMEELDRRMRRIENRIKQIDFEIGNVKRELELNIENSIVR